MPALNNTTFQDSLYKVEIGQEEHGNAIAVLLT